MGLIGQYYRNTRMQDVYIITYHNNIITLRSCTSLHSKLQKKKKHKSRVVKEKKESGNNRNKMRIIEREERKR